jgi:BMFP domain-containing protein YqiC
MSIAMMLRLEALEKRMAELEAALAALQAAPKSAENPAARSKAKR